MTDSEDLVRENPAQRALSFREHRQRYRHLQKPIDRLGDLAPQLFALLATITGDGYESFATHNTEIQLNVLWLASEMADEIDLLVSQLDSRPWPTEPRTKASEQPADVQR